MFMIDEARVDAFTLTGSYQCPHPHPAIPQNKKQLQRYVIFISGDTYV